MTTPTRFAATALVTATLLLAGCAGAPDPNGSTAAPDTTAAPDPYTSAEPQAAAPGEEICEIKTEFDRIDALLIKANRENPPAPSYRDAAFQLMAVIPPESIKADWIDLRDRVSAYYPIVESGDSAAIADQADEVVAISEVHLRLFGYFQSLCS